MDLQLLKESHLMCSGAPTFDVHGNYLMSINVSTGLEKGDRLEVKRWARAGGHPRAWPTAIVFTPIGGCKRDRCDLSQNMKMEIQGRDFMSQI
jgi:hypothetical protein